MTLVGDGLPGARQRETLCKGSSSPYPSVCSPRTPGNLGSHCAQEASLRRQRCSPWSPIRGDPSAVVLRPVVTTICPRAFFPHLCLPCPTCIPRSRGYGSSSPNKVPKMESFPKLPWPRTKMPKSLKNLLPVFHFAVCVCLPHPCTNPSRKGEKKVGETGSRAAPQAGCGCAGPAAPPAQLCAEPQRQKWALPVPARSLALGITGFCRD